MSSIDYREKYQALKLKFQSSVDLSFRLGYEQGQQDAQVEQMQQAQLAHQQAQMAPQVDENGQPIEGDQQQDPNAEQAQGSELDQHISQLEGMLGKSELNMDDLKKVVNDLKFAQEMKKSDKAVKTIAKNVGRFAISKQASSNLSPSAQKAVTMQEKIVQDIMKSWQEEESTASKEISKVLNREGLSKKS